MLDNIDFGSLSGFCFFLTAVLLALHFLIILPWLDEQQARRIVAQGNAEADRQGELRRQRETEREGVGR